MKYSSMKKAIRLFNVLVLVLILISPIGVSAEYYDVGEDLNVNSAILVDADTGMILTGKNIDKQFGMASITKLMSIYVAFDIIKEKNISLDEKVTISERVSKLKAESPEASGVWYEAGQEVTLKKLINLSLIYSDNSAIMAIAEYLSGSEQAHVDAMNKKAKELGMDDTIFYNVSGLTMEDYGSIQLEGTSPSDYNKSTARDLAIMARGLVDDYPKVLDITSKTSVEYNGEELSTWNYMLPDQLLEYDGVKGLKTGTSVEAGACFAGYYTDPDGRNLISIVLGAEGDSGESEEVARFTQTQKMYDWENELKYNTFIEKESTKSFEIPKSSKGKYDLHPATDVEMIEEVSPQLMLEQVDFNSKYFDEDGVKKDIPAGKNVLTAHYKVINEEDAKQTKSLNGEDGYLVVDYVSDSDINKENGIVTFFKSIPTYFKDLFTGIL